MMYMFSKTSEICTAHSLKKERGAYYFAIINLCRVAANNGSAKLVQFYDIDNDLPIRNKLLKSFLNKAIVEEAHGIY